MCKETEVLNKSKGDFTITTDKSKMNLEVIHNYLSKEAYWSKNIPFEKVKSAVENSLNFGIFYKDRQIGYGRIISDYSSVAYLGDVFVIEEFRKQGLSKWLLETIMEHTDLQGLRRWILRTEDAHGLYEQYGWKLLSNPDKWMEVHSGDNY